MPKPKEPLNAHVIAPLHETKVFYDGQLAVHTALKDGHATLHVISLRGGPHELETLPKLALRVAEGPCVIKPTGGKAKTLKAGGEINLPPGSRFALEATGTCAVLVGIPKPGPGLENGMRRRNLLL